jgi:hypothetical protein
MDPKELQNLIKEFKSLTHTVGIVAVLFFVAGILLMLIAWKFIVKKIEKAAETASEKSLKKFQAQLDQDNVKFQTQHEKQIDALEAVYQRFEALSSVLKYTMHGEKFTEHLAAPAQLQLLIKSRHEFKNTFHKNRLRLRSVLCERIEALLPLVDEYVEAFEGGIMPGPPEFSDDEEHDGLYISAMWPAGQLDGIVDRIDKIAAEIETDFRTAYGTAQ